MLGSLIETVEKGGFAILFVVPLAVPVATCARGGAATHVVEIVVVLFALQLVAGRAEIWLPRC